VALWLTDSDVPLRRFEHEVTRLLADGLLDAALDRLDDHGRSSPFTEVATLDIRSRRLEVGLAELQRLQERLADDPAARARFGLWADALVAERMLFDGDTASARWAATVLDGVTGEPYPPVPELFARARVRRIAALGFLFEPSPANRDASRRCRDGAVEDFSRCGFPVEVAVTDALVATFGFLMTQEQPRETAERVGHARAVVDGVPGSTWRPLLDALHGMIALSLGEHAVAAADFERATSGQATPLAGMIGRVGRALGALIASLGDPATLVAIDEAIAHLRRVSPRHAPTVQTLVAQFLADFGRPEMARYARPALDGPRLGPASVPEERLLRLRVDLMAGVVPPAEEVKAHLAELVELHQHRPAALYALGLARDYDRLGQHGEGEALRRWGLDRLPRPEECTPRELALSQPWAGPSSAAPPPGGAGAPPRDAPRAPAAARVVLRVLEPRLVLDVDGAPLRLRPTAAKLLLALVIRHPRPMNVEEVADLLWPGDGDDVRGRLNTLVHRLRSAAPALARSVVRTGDVLAFDDTTCEVDLLAYRAGLAGSGEARRGALAGVRGNLCEAQFPYDEPLIDERHAFAATWLRHARPLVAGGAAGAGDLSAALSALGLDPADLLGSASAR
jgi:hypothetical protein